MSLQRRRGQKAIVYALAKITDNRGNVVLKVDETRPIEVRAAFIPQRSSKAEVPGQQTIDVYRMLVDPNIPDVYVWNRVLWNGREWDVVAPPAIRYGTRRTRHQSVDIRERPNAAGEGV
ncbi:hypothetical protein [Cellulomonas sp. SG140]|uniref:hypothetical protein n=1 Tax=Cellulomonas sp. SG140 TaxID=2976536 RepID=UPI0021E71C62|nr:hypothetical protein [Cellulomonas sp. SG140]